MVGGCKGGFRRGGLRGGLVGRWSGRGGLVGCGRWESRGVVGRELGLGRLIWRKWRRKILEVAWEDRR